MKFIGDIMKRTKQTLSIVFLLVLLISSIFAVSATEYDVSNQSITSFDETLPDDVRYYPDGDLVSETIVASAGSSTGEHPAGSYVSTQAVGGAIYSNDDYTTPWITAVYLNFTIPSVSASIITVSLYSIYNYQTTTADTNEIGVWDGDSWEDFGDIDDDHFPPYDETWVNFTIGSEYIIDDIIMLRGYLENDDNIFIKVDYAEVSITSPIVLSSGTFADSFTGVSNWEVHTGNTITTDGDVATFTTEGDDAYNIYYCNAPSQSFENYYLEFRYSVNDTDADKLGISLKSGDSYTGDLIDSLGFYHDTTDYETHKFLLNGSDVVESISILIKDDDGDAPIEFDIDYFRISPANESGWQHDGSTTEGVVDDGDADFTYTKSSDGDILTLTTVFDTGGGTQWGNFHIAYDQTTTASDIETTYYPMFKIRWRCTEFNGDSVYLSVQGDGKKHSPLDGYRTTTFGWKTEYINFAAETTVGTNKYLDFVFASDTAGDNVTLEIDFTKFYSIAHYTVTQSGTSIDDVLYVDSGVLYCEGTSFTSIVLNHDPALDIERFGSWDMSTSSGTPEIDFYNSGAWVGYTSETEGYLESGTLTDFKLKFTDDANIAAVTFLITPPQWYEVSEAELIFIVPIDETGLDMLLIFLGLFMIPASTLYLVKGGRSGMSMDKLFFGLIAFVIGWALFLGGIM